MTGMGQSNLLTSKLVCINPLSVILSGFVIYFFVKSLTSHLVFFALKTNACADKLLFPVLRDNSRRMTGMGQSNLLTSKLVCMKN
jgi:2-methylaconitate cis-trans-isomerase PrpF